MAAGAWKDWAEGELVTEALFQDIQDSIAFIYASESAANTALTNKVEGTQFYDTGADKLKIWDGSAWVEVGAGGITTYDAWYFTSNITSNGDITSNWARNNSTGFAQLGTGMTESSGIFSFPSTGFYRIDVQTLSECRDQANPNVETNVTLNNSTYTTAMHVYFGDRSGLGTVKKHSGFTIVDVTDTSNVKVKFTTANLNSTNYLFGTVAGTSATRFGFTRLADT